MRLLLLAAVAVSALLVACGSGEDAGPQETASPSPEASPDLSPTVGGVEAMRRYLVDSGLDGKKGELTDPVDCAKLTDPGKAEGDFCIIDDASVYAPALVILFVADTDDVQNQVWKVRLERQEASWEVTDVQSVEQ